MISEVAFMACYPESYTSRENRILPVTAPCGHMALEQINSKSMRRQGRRTALKRLSALDTFLLPIDICKYPIMI